MDSLLLGATFWTMVFILFLSGGAGLAANGMKRFIFAQRIKNTPTSKVRSAAAGLVELSGKAAKGKSIKSPISGKACVYWGMVAEYYYKSRHASGWSRFYRDESVEPFFLEDGTGRMLIDPRGAEVDIQPDSRYKGHIDDKGFPGLLKPEPLDRKVLAYLKRHKAAGDAFDEHRGERFRIREYLLAAGDPAFVLGTATPTEGPRREVAHENLIVKKDIHEKILYISDISEKEVLAVMDLTSWASLLGGCAIMGGTVLYIALMLL